MFFKKPANTPTKHWYSGIFLITLSMVLLWLAIKVMQERFEFIEKTARAEGVVINQNSGKHHVTVQFTTNKGEIVRYNQNGLISYETGDPVTVLYFPENPKFRATTNGFGALWDTVIFIGWFVIGTFTIGFLCIFFPKHIHITGDK